MREIKFRQFCKEKDSVYYRLVGDGNWHTMQFTGLKDKNGVEIYEGDIVGRTDGQIWSVEYDESMASFVVYNQLNSFRRMEESITKTTIVGGIHEPVVIISVTDEIEIEAEVIGNIHENPELLEI